MNRVFAHDVRFEHSNLVFPAVKVCRHHVLVSEIADELKCPILDSFDCCCAGSLGKKSGHGLCIAFMSCEVDDGRRPHWSRRCEGRDWWLTGLADQVIPSIAETHCVPLSSLR